MAFVYWSHTCASDIVILFLFSVLFYTRYQKLQKGHAGDNESEHHTRDSAAKYVILEEIDEQDDGT